MQSECNEKITLKYTPCEPPTPCSDYDDYDPCESSDGIDEKDLAILLKEEQAKLQEAKEKARLAAEYERALQEARDKEEAERARASKKCGRKDEEKAAKKKCAKVIKNPFFGNRLEFSSDLPPPPPNPPPQFFPVPEEDDCKPKYPCPKRKRKCKKTKTDVGECKKCEDDVECTCDEDDGMLGKYPLFPDSDDSGNKTGQDQGEADDSRDKWKRKCKKPSNKFPCRKRDSDFCDPFQPRQIPARQRDLPARSPMELPEVERQIWLSADSDCPLECARNNCQMSCSQRKCKKKRQNSVRE